MDRKRITLLSCCVVLLASLLLPVYSQAEQAKVITPILSLLLGSGSATGHTETILIGWASADAPITGAKITIYNINGEQIYSSEKAVTGEIGFFMIPVKNLPADFKIVTINGSHHGQTFQNELSADYAGFNPDEDTIYINAVTTMVSYYLAEHTDKTLDSATAAVKKFLEIPEWIGIGKRLYASNQYFSHGLFLEEANASGGVHSFINQLIAEMDGNATHPFPSYLPPFDLPECPPLDAEQSCFVCEVIVDLFEKVAKEYIKQEEILKNLDEVCLRVPDSYSCICQSMVNDHGSDIIGWLLMKVQPKEVCINIGACPE